MPQVEDVPRSPAGPVEHVESLGLDNGPWPE